MPDSSKKEDTKKEENKKKEKSKQRGGETYLEFILPKSISSGLNSEDISSEHEDLKKRKLLSDLGLLGLISLLTGTAAYSRRYFSPRYALDRADLQHLSGGSDDRSSLLEGLASLLGERRLGEIPDLDQPAVKNFLRQIDIYRKDAIYPAVLEGLLTAGLLGALLLFRRGRRRKTLTDMLEEVGITDVEQQRELVDKYETGRSKARLRRALTGAAIGAPIGLIGGAANRTGNLLSVLEPHTLDYVSDAAGGALTGLLLGLLYHAFRGVK